MPALAQKFAAFLTEGIQRIRAQEGKPIAVIQDELGYAVGRQGGAAIEYWRKGHLPPQWETVERLAREIVRRGRMDRAWLDGFLESAGFRAPAPLYQSLYGAGEGGPSLAVPLDLLPDPAPLSAGSRIPYARNPLFVGRTRDLLALAAALQRGVAAAVSQVETAAATGLGGIGKTQLACEFVHRYGQFFGGGVFWLSFDNPKAIPAEIAACGGAGALELRPDFESRPLDEQVRLVRQAWQQPAARLLVFDNCEDPALLAQWRPPSGGCRVLVTSRRGDWERVLGVQMLALGVLDRAESVALLRHFRPDLDAAMLDAIAAEIGDLPLALHLAGSYLYRYRRAVSPERYLEQLRDPVLIRHPSFQAQGVSPTGHIQHVGRTFALSYERLDRTAPVDGLAQALLVRMAHFAPGEPVWYDLLVRTLRARRDEETALQVADGFARLVELGLVESEGQATGGQAVGGQAIRMHRLIAAFVRDVAGDEVAETQQAVEQVVFDEMAGANLRGYPIPLLARQVYLRAVVDNARGREDAQSAALCAELGVYLWHIGDYEAARGYHERSLALRQMLFGEEHLATAESLHLLGNVVRELDNTEEAKRYYERSLAVRERQLGPDHVDVAETLNSLGWLLWLERKAEPTRGYLERALQIVETKLGAGHRLTADYAINLGLCLQDCVGDLEGARRYFEMALTIREQILGGEPSGPHPLVANALNNMGYVLHALGALEEAQHYYERTLAVRRQLWDENHPDIAVSLKNLGTVVQAQGRLAQARTLLEEALAIYTRSVGGDHLRTSFCLDSLGLLLHEQGDLPGARRHLAQALAIRRKHYRADHPNLAVSLDHLGTVLARQGDAAARACLVEALAIRRQTLGDAHPLTQETQRRLEALADDKGTG